MSGYGTQTPRPPHGRLRRHSNEIKAKTRQKKFSFRFFCWLPANGKHEHGCQSHIGQMGIDWRANNLHHKDEGDGDGDDDDDNGHYGDNNLWYYMK